MAIRTAEVGVESILLRGIEANLQDQLIKKMTDEEVARFRTNIEAAVRAEVEKYVIKSVERFQSMHELAEKVGVVFAYKEVREGK